MLLQQHFGDMQRQDKANSISASTTKDDHCHLLLPHNC